MSVWEAMEVRLHFLSPRSAARRIELAKRNDDLTLGFLSHSSCLKFLHVDA